MHTVTLQALRHPARIDLLLRELVHALALVPDGAHEICDSATLPPALQRLAECASHLDARWACWRDEDGHLWFFVGEMPMPLSRQFGMPVLQLDQYEEEGLICATGRWLTDSDGKWRRCAAV